MWLIISVTVLIKFGYNQVMFLMWPSETDKCIYEREKEKERLERDGPTIYPSIELRSTEIKVTPTKSMEMQ